MKKIKCYSASIFDALRELLVFVQFWKRENSLVEVWTFSKVAGQPV